MHINISGCHPLLLFYKSQTIRLPQGTTVRLMGSIPFSWENKPGVSSTTEEMIGASPDQSFTLPAIRNVAGHGLNNIVPLPPCRSILETIVSKSNKIINGGSKKESKEWEDPFLAAYIKCTAAEASVWTQGRRRRRKKNRYALLEVLSCKANTGTRENALVKLSELHQVGSKRA